MSSETGRSRSAFRFRDRLSALKEKAKDEAIKHNITSFIHENLTSNDSNEDRSHSRFGFRQQMHQIKDVLKNKTHYQEIKEKVKDKFEDTFDLKENQTYPKAFFDQLFSPETENDVYLQTALICLWAIALLCIIPTLIAIFIPETNSSRTSGSVKMIFFHVFLCEFCYLLYVLLAMINVAQDFRLASFFCTIANYGMYVTIPIMQFALLFLSLERLAYHFDLQAAWIRVFTKPYLVQLILFGFWFLFIAVFLTVKIIREQFSFDFVKDQVGRHAPPIFGDVMGRIASRRHHCSIDGRLSSIFKTLIIILFVILIVKPIAVSLSLNFLTPCCCKNRSRRESGNSSERERTTLVTLFLLLNFFFSFPFYFVSMFNSIFTRIDTTKETFTLILKICFILRITNITFECLAFHIFQRNTWRLLSKCFHYLTCKKCPIFARASSSSPPQRRREEKKPRSPPNNVEPTETEEDDDDDDDGGKRPPPKKPTKPSSNQDDERIQLIQNGRIERKKTLTDDEDEEPTTTRRRSEEDTADEEEEKPRRTSHSKAAASDVRRTTKPVNRQSQVDNTDDDNDNETAVKPAKSPPTDDDESDDKEEQVKPERRVHRPSPPRDQGNSKRKSTSKHQSKVEESDDDDDDETAVKPAKSPPTDDDQSEDEQEQVKPERRVHRPSPPRDEEIGKRKSISKHRSKVEESDDEEPEPTHKTPRPKVEEEAKPSRKVRAKDGDVDKATKPIKPRSRDDEEAKATRQTRTKTADAPKVHRQSSTKRVEPAAPAPVRRSSQSRETRREKRREESSPARPPSISSVHEEKPKSHHRQHRTSTGANGTGQRSRSNAHQPSVSPRPKHKKKHKMTKQERILRASEPV